VCEAHRDLLRVDPLAEPTRREERERERELGQSAGGAIAASEALER
jgi:hypothetical protein